MSASITGTKAVLSELGSTYKLVVITATVGSASDTIAISKALHGITNAYAIVGAVVTGGMDGDFTGIQVALTSSTSITVVSVEADGTASDEWTGTTISISVLGI